MVLGSCNCKGCLSIRVVSIPFAREREIKSLTRGKEDGEIVFSLEDLHHRGEWVHVCERDADIRNFSRSPSSPLSFFLHIGINDCLDDLCICTPL